MCGKLRCDGNHMVDYAFSKIWQLSEHVKKLASASGNVEMYDLKYVLGVRNECPYCPINCNPIISPFL